MSNADDDKALTPRNESEADLLARWNIPDVTIEQEQIANAMNVPMGTSAVDVEPDEVIEEAPMLTAEALEEIRAAAREEGFAEGKQEGFIKGHQQGIETGHAEGLEQGINEGREQGLVQGQAEIDERKQQFDGLMRGLYQPQQQIDQIVERELVQLVSAVAQAVTRHELVSDPALILNTLKQAAELLPFQQQRVRVQLHPEDMDLVQSSYSDEQIQQRGWMLEPEAGLNRGDVRMLTEHSDVTIDMAQRLAKVSDIFLAQLNNLNTPDSAVQVEPEATVNPEQTESNSMESDNDPEPTP